MRARKHPVEKWKCQTYILYPSKDKFTSKEIVDDFTNTHSVNLTVLDGAEHYFTEIKYLQQLEIWLQSSI